MDEFYFEKLKKKVLDIRGFDLSQYSEGYVKRRINARIIANKLPRDSFREYIKIINSNPEEYVKLFDAFSINVTDFFRDKAVWDVLYKKFFSSIIEEKKTYRIPTLRIWAAGCSTGEEPYSIAILLKELIGRNTKMLITIMATDIDQGALENAQRGIYLARLLKNIRPEWKEKYFNRIDDARFRIVKEIKMMVTFKKHNFLNDKPFNLMDIIFCRNAAIYLTPEMKDKLIEKFYHSLVQEGLLVIGKSELIFRGKNKYFFYPVEIKEHIYQKERKDIKERMVLDESGKSVG